MYQVILIDIQTDLEYRPDSFLPQTASFPFLSMVKLNSFI